LNDDLCASMKAILDADKAKKPCVITQYTLEYELSYKTDM